jgi:hypothetical protein
MQCLRPLGRVGEMHAAVGNVSYSGRGPPFHPPAARGWQLAPKTRFKDYARALQMAAHALNGIPPYVR